MRKYLSSLVILLFGVISCITLSAYSIRSQYTHDNEVSGRRDGRESASVGGRRPSGGSSGRLSGRRGSRGRPSSGRPGRDRGRELGRGEVQSVREMGAGRRPSRRGGTSAGRARGQRGVSAGGGRRRRPTQERGKRAGRQSISAPSVSFDDDQPRDEEVYAQIVDYQINSNLVMSSGDIQKNLDAAAEQLTLSTKENSFAESFNAYLALRESLLRAVYKTHPDLMNKVEKYKLAQLDQRIASGDGSERREERARAANRALLFCQVCDDYYGEDNQKVLVNNGIISKARGTEQLTFTQAFMTEWALVRIITQKIDDMWSKLSVASTNKSMHKEQRSGQKRVSASDPDVDYDDCRQHVLADFLFADLVNDDLDMSIDWNFDRASKYHSLYYSALGSSGMSDEATQELKQAYYIERVLMGSSRWRGEVSRRGMRA